MIKTTIVTPCIAIIRSSFGTEREVYIESETEDYFYGESEDGVPTGFLKRMDQRRYGAGWEFMEYSG